MSKLTARETELLVKHFIGLDEHGNLIPFMSGENLEEFFQVWCDLDIKPTARFGTQVRDEFIQILHEQTPPVQAKILRTVIGSLRLGEFGAPQSRNRQLQTKLSDVASRLESATVLVEDVAPQSRSEVVHLALNDAEHLISRGSARSAVDRTHTALHGYLKELCDDASIKYGKDPGMPELYKLVREQHPTLKKAGPRQQDIDSICRTLGNIVDKLGPIRNRATPSHPKEELIEEAEAILAINAARTLFHYLEDKRRPRGQSMLQKLFGRR